MKKVFKFCSLAISAVFLISNAALADGPGLPAADISVGIPINISVGEIKTLSAITKNVSDDVAHAIVFSSPGTTTWTVADQYVDITYNCNLALWGIRIISDNKAAYPGMYGKPIGTGPNSTYDGSPEQVATSDDACSYSGLIDLATKTNPDNRATLAWQVFSSKTDNPTPTINDNSLKGLTATGTTTNAYNWNAPWAAMVDIGNTTGGTPQASYLVDLRVDPDSDTDTVGYMYVVQGGASGSGLNFHPAQGSDPTNPLPRTADGKAAVFLAARFAGISAGSYGTQMYVQLVRAE